MYDKRAYSDFKIGNSLFWVKICSTLSSLVETDF